LKFTINVDYEHLSVLTDSHVYRFTVSVGLCDRLSPVYCVLTSQTQQPNRTCFRCSWWCHLLH